MKENHLQLQEKSKNLFIKKYIHQIKCHSTSWGTRYRLDQENYYCTTQNYCFNSLFDSNNTAIQYEYSSTVRVPIHKTLAGAKRFYCSTTHEIKPCVICDN